jgi:hypothetical protein
MAGIKVKAVGFVMVGMLAAGCSLFRSEEPQIAGAPPPGVSYRFQGDHGDADRRAASYCGQYGKTAKLAKTTQSSGTDQIAEYECD